MIVSVNTICFFDRDRNNYLSDDYWVKTFLKIAEQHPEHHFIFFIEKPFAHPIELPNLQWIVFGDIPDNFLRARIWFRYRMKKELKKNLCDMLFQIGGFPFKSKMPQVLISPDLIFSFQPERLTKNELVYLKKRLPVFYKNLQEIIVASQFEKNTIEKKFEGLGDMIKVWPQPAPANLIPFTIEEKERVKEQYAEGNEFFIYSGLIGTHMNLMNLLKAFSAFKKRQKSKMKLIIAGNAALDFDVFSSLLASYRFKNEVVIAVSLSPEERINLLGSSYAVIFSSEAEIDAVTTLQAMGLGIPILAPEQSLVKEIATEAALYFSPEDFKSIAEKMMLIFKDENLKKELVKKGLEKVHAYKPSNNPSDFLNLLNAYTKKSL